MLPITSVSLQTATIVSNQWLQLWLCPGLCPRRTKYHHFRLEHHGQPDDFSPSGQAWSCSGSNMHWRSSNKCWSCNNSIHHSKSAIVSSEYQMYTQCPFWRSPNSTKNIPQEKNSQRCHRDKSKSASADSHCCRLHTHLDSVWFCPLQCNTSKEHPYTNPF